MSVKFTRINLRFVCADEEIKESRREQRLVVRLSLKNHDLHQRFKYYFEKSLLCARFCQSYFHKFCHLFESSPLDIFQDILQFQSASQIGMRYSYWPKACHPKRLDILKEKKILKKNFKG